MIITENRLDEWVRGNARDAQGVIVELIYRLVAASSPQPKERRFPLGDSIGQQGPDGMLDTDFSFDPFVPGGRSFWEIGTGITAGRKATSDYRGLTDATPEEIRRGSTFIFITPLSGSKDWQYTWKEDAQAAWIKERRENNEWKDVRVIDGSGLIDWLRQFPAVELWLLATMMGPSALQIETLEQRWADLSCLGSPPPLIPDVFLGNRDTACIKLKEIFDGITLQLKLDTRFPSQMADFTAAYVESLDKDTKVDVVGRCLIISCAEKWNAITSPLEPHFLIADFDIDDDNGTKLLSRARREGHAVIFRGMPGGIPHPNRASLPNPRSNQIKDALEKAGYNIERARTIAQKSDGNLGSLLRLLQNLSLMPEWSQGTNAAELAIAELLGAWRDNSEADKEAAEELSGKGYGEWIRTMREISLSPNTPLSHRDDTWKVISRYEGWYSLGPKLFDEHMDRLKEVAIEVLLERDPMFELPSDKRFAASAYGKVLSHSYLLRKGLAESITLVGCHPKALTSCSSGKAETTAILTVREILYDADWVLWASLNDFLPLLAEAAPGEFLDAVEKALISSTCPFDTVLAQEGSDITSRNYMTGLLWALETLAWDADYLIRVVIILGELAAKDPGGSWSNRPANSLSTILLPWFPQTCAPVTKRKAAVNTLLNELPDVAWKLLLSLLPQSHQISAGSRKPAWREIIPDDWSQGATHREYWEQITDYAELAISAAKGHLTKLIDLIDRLDDLPSPSRDQILAHLDSDTVVSMPEADKAKLWTELANLVSKHRKFADAKWAMKPEDVDKIATIAERLASISPIYRYRRYFSERDFDLFEEKGDYEEQRRALDEKRQNAVSEIFTAGGIEAVLEFATAVESPWRAGIAFGVIAANETESGVLPRLLESENNSLVQFVGGFIQGRFLAFKWKWVDEINTIGWTTSQKGQFLAYLPFTSDTWVRIPCFLGCDESFYWSKTSVRPYGADPGLEMAIDRLVEHGRASSAILCLEQMRYKKRSLDSRQIVRVLQAVLQSPECLPEMDIHATIDVIKALQEDPSTNPDDLFQIEWAFLPLLDGDDGTSPKLLERRLAEDPTFFCEVIGAVFLSKKESHSAKEPAEQQKNNATNAYHLLRNWSMPPGCQKDGTYNGDALIAWLEKVKEICQESGHFEVGLSMVGQVLIHVPPDPDGLWIHHSAAKALNAKDVKDMRDGFQTALINSRGVFLCTAGEEERTIAAKYSARADEVEARNYHRLANTLREVASFYEREAEIEASRNRFDE